MRFFFFFSSRRRHTRCGRDWSSDVCSSDLEAMAGVVAGLDLSRIRTRICAAGELAGFERYDEILAQEPPGPLTDEREGREMLYSSGTTGRPKGVRKQLPGTTFGDPSSAPVQVAHGIGAI